MAERASRHWRPTYVSWKGRAEGRMDAWSYHQLQRLYRGRFTRIWTRQTRHLHGWSRPLRSDEPRVAFELVLAQKLRWAAERGCVVVRVRDLFPSHGRTK